MTDTPMTQDKHDTLVERLEAAKNMIGNMCSQLRPPKMSIPARPDYDEDILIIGVLEEAISRLKQRQAALDRLLEAAQREPTAEGFSDNMIAAMKNARKVIEG